MKLEAIATEAVWGQSHVTSIPFSQSAFIRACVLLGRFMSFLRLVLSTAAIPPTCIEGLQGSGLSNE